MVRSINGTKLKRINTSEIILINIGSIRGNIIKLDILKKYNMTIDIKLLTNFIISPIFLFTFTMDTQSRTRCEFTTLDMRLESKEAESKTLRKE